MEISVFEMVANAGLVVKFVLLTLLTFSVISWSIVIMKQLAYRRVAQESREFLDQFWDSKTLNEAYDSAKRFDTSPEAAVFVCGINELRRISSSRTPRSGSAETLEMHLASLDILKRAIQKAQSIEYDRLGRSLSFLATTGSATPFIGLFGTVWGIMDAFQNIGMRGSASLAVVAPGIAEALIATAIGLAVAIPAVIFYNFYSNKLAEIEAEMSNFATDFLNLIERDMLTKA